MTGKKRTATPRGKAKSSVVVYPASAVTIAACNLLNMAIVSASCGTVLLGLMIVKHY